MAVDARGVAAVSRFLYDEQGFSGNREHYDDPRNSFLNEVLDRRTGIPITLAVVYIEVARRAGVRVEGVNFPGHFLVRASDGHHHRSVPRGRGRRRARLPRAAQSTRRDEAAFDRSLLEPATRRQIVTRMLVNLKRSYVRMRSMPQARVVADLLVALDPSALGELRDRGLLAYHLDDFAAALARSRDVPPPDAEDRRRRGEPSGACRTDLGACEEPAPARGEFQLGSAEPESRCEVTAPRVRIEFVDRLILKTILITIGSSRIGRDVEPIARSHV